MTTRGGRLLATMALAAALGACGGGDGGGGSCPEGQVGVPPNCTSPCAQTTLVQESVGVPPGTLLHGATFRVTATGRLDVTFDWTDPASEMGVYVVPEGTCEIDEFNDRTCEFLIRSEPPSLKPRRVSRTAIAPGTYDWLIANFSDARESGSLLIVLSQGSCPPLVVAAPPTVSALGAEALPTDAHEARS